MREREPLLRRRVDRRGFIGGATASAVALIAGACARSPVSDDRNGSARLMARPGERSGDDIAPGVHDLSAAIGGEAALFVPAAYRADRSWPLFVMLHGAGASRGLIHNLFPVADEHGFVVLAPKSMGRTWDLVLGGYGPDVVLLDRALAHTFGRCAIDPGGVALAGFSDGGSYALSLGLGNGDLFTHLVGFSPGFLAPPGRVGRPAIYIAHGTADAVLPIATTGRAIERQLRDLAYDVTFREFEGQHAIYLSIVEEALGWVQA